MKSFFVALLLWSAVGAQAQAGATPPPHGSSAVRRAAPSSVDAGDYIYISAQGPRGADGALPATFAAQARHALSNLKSVVETVQVLFEQFHDAAFLPRCQTALELRIGVGSLTILRDKV